MDHAAAYTVDSCCAAHLLTYGLTTGSPACNVCVIINVGIMLRLLVTGCEFHCMNKHADTACDTHITVNLLSAAAPGSEHIVNADAVH